MAWFIPCAGAKYPRLPQIASSGAIVGAREKDINRAPSAPRKQSAQASKLCFIAFANTPCAMRRGTASHLAAGHTAAAVSCRLARRREAVLQPLRTRAVPPKPLAYSAARCSGASRGRQTARGSLLPTTDLLESSPISRDERRQAARLDYSFSAIASAPRFAMR
jgi:hypothetical protein